MAPADLPPPSNPEQRVLITGAAGAIGSSLRDNLAGRYRHLRLADLVDVGDVRPGEEHDRGDIQEMDACLRMTRDVDCIVHLAGQATESTWERVLGPNIIGCYNVYEACRQNGVKRFIFASSNHAVGFHRTDRLIDRTAQTRPDSRYGVSKVFGEAMGRLYADKHGMQVACMRIGSFQPKPQDRRQLSTWFSPDDLARMVAALIDAERFHFITPYGASPTSRPYWTNADITEVAFDLKDNADDYAGADLPEMTDAVARDFVGGPYAAAEFTGDAKKIDR